MDTPITTTRGYSGAVPTPLPDPAIEADRPAAAHPDVVTRLRSAWAQTQPQLDTAPLEVLGRITRIGMQATQAVERVLEPSGVTRSEFDVLCALARADRPLRASEVTAQTMLSGAATTKLTTRLEAAGLIERRGHERDGRVVLLALTDSGSGLVEEQMPRCLAQDAELLAGLDDDDRATLARLLAVISANADALA